MFLIFLTLINLFSNYSDKDWDKKIVPLVSDREQVETLIGKPIDTNCFNCIYRIQNEKIIVNYAVDRCKGELSGWNVPKNTVLSFSVQMSENSIKFDTLKDKKTDYLIVTSDDLVSKYINPKKGIVYKISTLNKLEEILFLPKEDKIDRRCKGFPKYNVAGVIYRPIISFADLDIEYGKSIIENHLINLKLSELNLTTYLIIYSGENFTDTKYKNYLVKINKFLKTIPELTLAKVHIVNNVKKEKFQVDIFSLPSDYPAPVPDVKNEESNK